VNTGPESVRITDLQASCGCLTPRVIDREYAPGQKGELLLEINTLTHNPGPHTWTLQVLYRAGVEKRRANLRVTATVRAEILVEPAALTVYTTGQASHGLTLTDLRIKPLEITRVISSCAQLTGRVTKKSQDAHGHAVRTIGVEVGDDFPEGRHDEVLAIVTNDPGYPELRVRVTVHKGKRQRVTAAPDQLNWRTDADMPLPSQLVRLRDGENKPVVVERAVADHPAVTCRWATGPGPMVTLRISVDRPRVGARKLESAVHVHISHPVRTVVTIPLLITR
jgi:hypothetical protein